MDRSFAPRLVEFEPQDSEELTSFDRKEFAGFHEVDDEYYEQLFRDEARIIGHRGERGDVISVAALFPRPLSDPVAPRLEQQFPSWAAFLDGAAVTSRYRRSQRPDLDLHGELLDWRINAARDLGKTAALTVVRADNRPSDSNLRRKGFHALVDAPRYYGPRPADDRIAGALPIDANEAISWPHSATPTPLAEVEDALKYKPNTIALSLPTGNDPHYRHAVSRLLQSGYMSHANPQYPSSTIPFAHLETSPALSDKVRSRLLMIRGVLHRLCEPVLEA